MSVSRPAVILAIALLTLGFAPVGPAAGQKDPPPRLPTEKEIMAAKLKHAEVLPRAVTLEDYKQIEQTATALEKISKAAEFLNAYRTEEYQFQAVVFQRAAARMAADARDKNSDGVMLAYLDLTKTCMACHQTFRTRKRD
jgi:3-deoxy-D-arabino-heptulosonate 7-phosphate (DAHP) synthase